MNTTTKNWVAYGTHVFLAVFIWCLPSINSLVCWFWPWKLFNSWVTGHGPAPESRSANCWPSVSSRWSVEWLLVSGVTVGYLYHPCGQWCDCWLSVSSRWSVVWLLAIFITKVVSGVIAGYLYHPGGQWCDCWPPVSSRWPVMWLLAICIVHLAVVWLLAICIIQVVSGVTAHYLYHQGGQWCDCWLSIPSRWSVVRLLAICVPVSSRCMFSVWHWLYYKDVQSKPL